MTGSTAARPTRRRQGRADLAHRLRLGRPRWEQYRSDDLTRAAFIVVGAWVVLAWARFGSQTVNGPRVFTRFVLVGVYAWFGLTGLLWAVARIRNRALPDGASDAGHVSGLPRLLAMVGATHQPLLIGGLLLWLLQMAPHSVLNTIIGIAAVAWMGGQLVVAAGAFEQRSLWSAAPTTLAVWALWLATAGQFLATRIGHLV